MKGFIWKDLARRPLFFPVLAFVLGDLFAPSVKFSPQLYLVTATVLALFAVVLRRKTGAHLILLVSMALAGTGLAKLQMAHAPSVTAGFVGQTVVEGEIEGVRRLDDSTELRVSVWKILSPLPAEAHFRVRLYVRPPIELFPGQTIIAPTLIRAIEPPPNPGQFSSYPLLVRQGILFQGGVESSRLIMLSPPARWRVKLATLQKDLADKVHQLSPTPEAGALYLTLAAGLRSELTEEWEDRFATSGLAHILSVSGLHVAALALALLALTRFLAVYLWRGARIFDAKRISAPACLILIWTYVLFTGWQPPAIRSAWMASVLFLGMAAWQPSDALNGLMVAAFCLLVVDPSAVMDLSLQLSFLAVLSLILVSPVFEEWFIRPPKTILKTFYASLAVMLGSFPLVASVFHRVSLAGFFSNVLCLPLSALVTFFAAGGAAIFFFSTHLATPILFLGTCVSQLIIYIVRAFSAFPYAALHVPAFPGWLAGLYFAGLTAFALNRGRWRWLGLAVPLSLALCFILPQLVHRKGLTVTFLAVGHGDAIVLKSHRHFALVDGGGNPQGADIGKRIVLPYLFEQAVSHLDLTVLSHPHADHALGLISTLAEIPTEQLWIPSESTGDPLAQRVSQVAGLQKTVEVRAGYLRFQLGEAEIEVLGPPRDESLLSGHNNRSVVVAVRHGAVSFLLTGDIEAPAEHLLETDVITVLKAPHHGSRTSSSVEFLDRARPRYVVFCVGKTDHFGFPHPEVVQRYQQRGTQCFRTDQQGAIEFYSDGKTLTVTPYIQPLATR